VRSAEHEEELRIEDADLGKYVALGRGKERRQFVGSIKRKCTDAHDRVDGKGDHALGNTQRHVAPRGRLQTGQEAGRVDHRNRHASNESQPGDAGGCARDRLHGPRTHRLDHVLQWKGADVRPDATKQHGPPLALRRRYTVIALSGHFFVERVALARVFLKGFT
jgi:hypothetical protein